MKENPEMKPEGRVENPEEAEAGAYAEKPFRDAARNDEYLEKAPPGGKEFLDWVASNEGEKAMALFRTQSGSERARAKEILLKKALEGIRVSNTAWSVEHRKGEWMPSSYDFLSGKEKGQVFDAAAEIARIVAKPEIEKILEGVSADKTHKIASIARVFSTVLEKGAPSEPAKKFIGSPFNHRELQNYICEADFAWRLVRGYSPSGGLYFLAQEAEAGIREEKISEKVKDLIRNYQSLIEGVREGAIGGLPDRFIKERAKGIDQDLEHYGFVFDEESRKYIEA